MKKYTIYCTEEQTKKAYELGAPIMTFGYEDLGDIKEKVLSMNKQAEISKTENGGIIVGQIPTAEQMIGWLEEHINSIDVLKNSDGTWMYMFYPTSAFLDYKSKDRFSSRKEATLAAIDSALDYLIENK